MAGHLGAERVTTQNLEIVRVDVDKGLILVLGAVPGSAGSWVEIRDAVKGVRVDDLPMPGKFRTLDEQNAPAKDDAAEAPASDAAPADDAVVNEAPAETPAGEEETKS